MAAEVNNTVDIHSSLINAFRKDVNGFLRRLQKAYDGCRLQCHCHLPTLSTAPHDNTPLTDLKTLHWQIQSSHLDQCYTTLTRKGCAIYKWTVTDIFIVILGVAVSLFLQLISLF